MQTIQILRNGQITLPIQIRHVLGLEYGDYLEPEIKNKSIVLKPKKLVDSSQAWFWAKEWQKGEREADEDIKKSRVYGPFDNARDLLKSLKS
ncbi:MAG: AbrB/MazE/SpoVT family DNA-binding domain-containing protein [bacterium]